MKVEDIIERLYRLDEDAELTFSDDIEFKCYIVGGGAFMIMGYAFRATHDIESERVVKAIDWKRLDELACSMKSQMFSKTNYDNFYYNYQNYVKRFKDEEIDIERIRGVLC